MTGVRVAVLSVHIIAGAMGIVLGFIALYAAKGKSLHRKSGTLFVYTMLVMSLLGATMAAVWGVAPTANIPAGLLTAYLVVTALTTVRPLPGVWSRRANVGLLLIALFIAVFDLSFAFAAAAGWWGKRWMLVPLLIFGTIAMLAVVGDVRMIRHGALRGVPRLTRHLWRMSFALFVAAASFFLGQAKVFPKPIRIPGLLSLPVLAVLLTMLYWLWRVRFKRSIRGLNVQPVRELEFVNHRPVAIRPADPVAT